MYTSGDTRKLAFTIDDQKINEILTTRITSATTRDSRGAWGHLDMKINESTAR